MSIERFHTNDRMSQMVIHGDTVYLAGRSRHRQVEGAEPPPSGCAAWMISPR